MISYNVQCKLSSSTVEHGSVMDVNALGTLQNVFVTAVGGLCGYSCICPSMCNVGSFGIGEDQYQYWFFLTKH